MVFKNLKSTKQEFLVWEALERSSKFLIRFTDIQK